MMVGVNLFSLTFTSLSLIQSGGFISSLEFLNNHPEARRDVFILSMCRYVCYIGGCSKAKKFLFFKYSFFYSLTNVFCSAVGQMFLFYTIKHFGPIVLTIIMTCRQMFSMIMSYIRQVHDGIFGV